MFEGFSTPTYTQTPNEFFDIVMQKDISKSEIKILAFMIRYTFGWHRVGFGLQFTFKDIQDMTNMGSQQVNDGLKKCLDKGYIERKEINDVFVYRLKMQFEDDLPWDLTFNWKRVVSKDEEQHFENQSEDTLKIKVTHFENQSEDTLKIKVDECQPNHAPQGTKLHLKKSLNKSIKKNTKTTNNIESENVVVVFEKMKQAGIKTNKSSVKALLNQVNGDIERILRLLELASEKGLGFGWIKTRIDENDDTDFFEPVSFPSGDQLSEPFGAAQKNNKYDVFYQYYNQNSLD